MANDNLITDSSGQTCLVTTEYWLIPTKKHENTQLNTTEKTGQNKMRRFFCLLALSWEHSLDIRTSCATLAEMCAHIYGKRTLYNLWHSLGRIKKFVEQLFLCFPTSIKLCRIVLIYHSNALRRMPLMKGLWQAAYSAVLRYWWSLYCGQKPRWTWSRVAVHCAL